MLLTRDICDSDPIDSVNIFLKIKSEYICEEQRKQTLLIFLLIFLIFNFPQIVESRSRTKYCEPWRLEHVIL